MTINELLVMILSSDICWTTCKDCYYDDVCTHEVSSDMTVIAINDIIDGRY